MQAGNAKGGMARRPIFYPPEHFPRAASGELISVQKRDVFHLEKPEMRNLSGVMVDHEPNSGNSPNILCGGALAAGSWRGNTADCGIFAVRPRTVLGKNGASLVQLFSARPCITVPIRAGLFMPGSAETLENKGFIWLRRLGSNQRPSD